MVVRCRRGVLSSRWISIGSAVNSLKRGTLVRTVGFLRGLEPLL